MKRPAIFFDRDNTLIVSDGYLGDPAGVRLVTGAAEAIARARLLGYATVVVSNQSGVARGMFTEEAVKAVNARLDESLVRQNPAAIIDRHEFCPDHPEATIAAYRRDSDRRKPKPGMILHAAEAMALDLPRSWVVGDTPRDVAAGHAAGCRTILFADPSLPASPATTEASAVQPTYSCASLSEAMDYIQNHSIPAADAEDPASPAEASPPPDLSSPHAAGEPQPAEPGPEAARLLATLAAIEKPLARLESQLDRIQQELARRSEDRHDFSVSRLMAGITQVVVLAVLFVAYLNRSDSVSLLNVLVLALVLQALTIALLIMSRQR